MSDRTINESTYREVVEALQGLRFTVQCLSAPNPQHDEVRKATDKADAALASLQALSPAQATLTDDDIDALWTYRKNIHNGELTPQLRDFARAAIQAALPRGEEPTPAGAWVSRADNCIRLCRYGTAPPDMLTQPCACAEGECCLGRTPPLAPSVVATDMHAAIMNLPARDREEVKAVYGDSVLTAYYAGHRDARHAAASLVGGAPIMMEPAWNHLGRNGPPPCDEGSVYIGKWWRELDRPAESVVDAGAPAKCPECNVPYGYHADGCENLTPDGSPEGGAPIGTDRIMEAADKYWEASTAARYRVRDALEAVVREVVGGGPSPDRIRELQAVVVDKARIAMESDDGDAMAFFGRLVDLRSALQALDSGIRDMKEGE